MKILSNYSEIFQQNEKGFCPDVKPMIFPSQITNVILHEIIVQYLCRQTASDNVLVITFGMLSETAQQNTPQVKEFQQTLNI